MRYPDIHALICKPKCKVYGDVTQQHYESLDKVVVSSIKFGINQVIAIASVDKGKVNN